MRLGWGCRAQPGTPTACQSQRKLHATRAMVGEQLELEYVRVSTFDNRIPLPEGVSTLAPDLRDVRPLSNGTGRSLAAKNVVEAYAATSLLSRTTTSTVCQPALAPTQQTRQEPVKRSQTVELPDTDMVAPNGSQQGDGCQVPYTPTEPVCQQSTSQSQQEAQQMSDAPQTQHTSGGESAVYGQQSPEVASSPTLQDIQQPTQGPTARQDRRRHRLKQQPSTVEEWSQQEHDSVATQPQTQSLDSLLTELDSLLQDNTAQGIQGTAPAVSEHFNQQQSLNPSYRLLSKIKQLPDIASVKTLWSSQQHFMRPKHVTAIWLRLRFLVQNAAVRHEQQMSQWFAAHHAETAIQGQAGVGKLPHTQLRVAYQPSNLWLWDSLQDTSRFQAASCNAGLLVSVLQSHTVMHTTAVRLAADLRSARQHQQQQQQRRQPQQRRLWHKDPINPTMALGQQATLAGTASDLYNSSSSQQSLGVDKHRTEGINYKSGRLTGVSWQASTETQHDHLTKYEERLASRLRRNRRFVADMLKLSIPVLSHATPQQLTSLLACTARLDHLPSTQWLNSFWSASQPQLARMSLYQLQTMVWCIGHLRLQPPQSWCMSLYSSTQQYFHSASTTAISAIAHGVARRQRPPRPWLNSLLSAAQRQDGLDPPGYALLLHAMGRLRLKPSQAWFQEFWDSTATCLGEFTAQELSLLLKGAAYLQAQPDSQWQSSFWQESQAQLQAATTEQLASIGWAVIVGLRLRPPGPWISIWLGALRHRLDNMPVFERKGGTQALRQGSAIRVSRTLALLNVSDLARLCAKLGVPVPADTVPGPWEQALPTSGDSLGHRLFAQPTESLESNEKDYLYESYRKKKGIGIVGEDEYGESVAVVGLSSTMERDARVLS